MNKNNNLTWREQTYKCKANGITAIDFTDTMPNQALIYNYSDYNLYAGISCTPSSRKYDSKVNPHNTGFIGRPNGFKEFLIYNPNSVDIDVRIYSVYAEFDLSNFQNDVNEVQTIQSVEVTKPLPAGENKIGEVALSEPLVTYLANLPQVKDFTNDTKIFLEIIKNHLTIDMFPKIASIKDYESQTLAKVSDIHGKATNILDAVVGNRDYSSQILAKVTDIVSWVDILNTISQDISKIDNVWTWVTANNRATELELTRPTENGVSCLHFNMIANDSNSVLNLQLKVGTSDTYEDFLTILAGETLYNIDVPIGGCKFDEPSIKFTGTDMMYRVNGYFKKI